MVGETGDAVLHQRGAEVKTRESMDSKVRAKGYSVATGRLLQDLVGVRVAAYFSDDVDLIYQIVGGLFDEVNCTVDVPDAAVFGPSRFNIVYRMPSEAWAELSAEFDLAGAPVDSTLELQLRTVFSEGWHETEHDLRYKRREDWEGESGLNRALNGLVATLETCDWSTLELFDRLAYHHYKARRWEPMLRTKLRVRLTGTPLRDEIKRLLTDEASLSRALVRLRRADFLGRLYALEQEFDLPLSPENMVFVGNRMTVALPAAVVLEPPILRRAFESVGGR